jgi:hypothetical protein
MRLCLAFWKRSPITVRLAAWLMVLRSAQWLGADDQVVLMVSCGFAPFVSQYRALSRSGVVVVREWPLVDVAVTFPGVGAGLTAMV